MIRAAGTIIALTLAVVPALGQDRPPDAPQTDGAQTEQPDAERPSDHTEQCDLDQRHREDAKGDDTSHVAFPFR